MADQSFHHALTISLDRCIGCTHCMKVCPTGAIRVREGKAFLFANRCIDCGECMRVCPSDAIFVEQDDFSKIFGYKYRVAIVPAVFIGQFARNIPTRRIYSTLLAEGFTHIYEAEHGVEALSEALRQYQQAHTSATPVISSFCPAIVRLIQVRFPSLTDHIMLLRAPLDLAAINIRKYLLDQGARPNEIGIFYITPCAAKIAAVKSPVGEERSVMDGVINLNFMYNKLAAALHNDNTESCPVPQKDQLIDKAMLWPLTKGESPHATGRSLAIDGIHNVIEFLEKVENEEAPGFDFLELRACDQSCAGGILTVENRFLTTERLHDRAQQFRDDLTAGRINLHRLVSYDKEYLIKNAGISPVAPRAIDKLDDDLEEALRKMERLRSLMCYLPGIDCGACGSPSCKAFAEDIVQRRANISECVFVQKSMQKRKKLSPELGIKIVEKIWGEKKLEKDCTKKGAKYEHRRPDE